nr:unnamed protein product [Digitaria exilis]
MTPRHGGTWSGRWRRAAAAATPRPATGGPGGSFAGSCPFAPAGGLGRRRATGGYSPLRDASDRTAISTITLRSKKQIVVPTMSR